MALRPANNLANPRLENAKLILLSLMTITLFLWPKYVTIGSAGMRMSPYNLLILLGFSVGMVGLLYKNYSTPSIGVIGWISIAAFTLLYAVRFYSDLQYGSVADSVYYDLRDFVWYGSPFLIALLLGIQARGLDAAIRVICIAAPILLALSFIEIATHQTIASLIIFNLNVDIDPAYATSLVATKMRDGLFRAQAIFQHPIVFGEVMAAILPVAIACAFQRRGRILAVLAAGSAVVGCLLTGSRAAQAALIIGMLVFGLAQFAMSRKSTTWVIGLVCVPIIIPMVLGAIDYFTELAAGQSAAEQASSHARVVMWIKGWPEFLKQPFLGHGGGSSLGIAGLKGTGGVYTIDDYYLSLLLDGGGVGLAMLMFWLATVAAAVFFFGGTPQERRVRAGLMAGICAVLAGQKAASIPESMSYMFFFGGLIIASRRPLIRRRTGGSSRQLRLTFEATT
jgi:hypothetical protein